MRVVVVALFVVACTKPNPDVCCATEEQCAQLGVSDIRPCDIGQACSADFACIAAECTTSADCTSPGAPVCSLGLCVANCRVDDDCAEVAGKPICAADGVCVGCERADQCPANAAICDVEDRACRGCATDSECADGICLEADGVCAAEAAAVFVASSGGSDAGECTKTAPCSTLSFGLGKVTATRNIMRLEGGGTFVLGAAFAINKPVYIDGTANTISLSGAGPAVRVAGVSNEAVLSHVTVTAGSGAAIDVASTNSLRVLDLQSGGITVQSATLDATSSTIAGVKCTSGTASLHDSIVPGGAAIGGVKAVDSSNCQLIVERTLFDDCGGSIAATGGLVRIENNIIIESDGLTDSMFVQTVAPGSTIRFNTFVNTTAVVSDGVALGCDSTVAVTSNIFAYNSMHPMGPPSNIGVCATTFSLFDNQAVPQQTGGNGNQVADATTFFVDRAAGNFRPAASSPAKEASEPGLTNAIDFERQARPQPAGTISDVGAFEVP